MKRLIIVAACLTASAGFAEPPASQPKADAVDSHNPNETICRRVQALGSRLTAGRMCRTRAEWEQQRMADRMGTERAQTNRIIPRP